MPDFIDLHIGDYHWFIFNVADIFITLGIIGLLIVELTKKKKFLKMFKKNNFYYFIIFFLTSCANTFDS